MALEFIKQVKLTNDAVFQGRVAQSAYSSAVAIANESSEMQNHKERLQLSNTVIVNWDYVQEAFLRLVLTQLSKEEPSDEEINIAVSSVWDVIAKAMFPTIAPSA